ncbi:MAG: flagellar assembly protein FliW [Thermoguttaceae bacterium]|jgi:flagellar assembly factor FliW
MNTHTTRFGQIEFDAEDVIHFPEGLLGLDGCRQWVLLADAGNDALAWMQSVDRAEVALAVVSPRRFVPGYRLRVARRELEPLQFQSLESAEVLIVVGKSEQAVTLNLKAPLVINLDLRLGRQVITNGDMPIQYELASETSALKKSA